MELLRRVEAVLVAHIAEVDARRLYIREAPSMFAYCMQVLHLSEHEAYARIAAARASRRHPMRLAMLSDGRLHVSAIGKLAPHLTDANAAELLARAAHRSKAEIEELIAEIAPKPDVPAVVRKLPASSSSVTTELGPHRIRALTSTLSLPPVPSGQEIPPPASPAPLPSPVAMPPTPLAPSITALAPARYKVQFTAGAELREKLERLQALLRQDLAMVLETAVTEKLERLEAKRFGLAKAPRATLADTDTSPRSRHLPAAATSVCGTVVNARCSSKTAAAVPSAAGSSCTIAIPSAAAVATTSRTSA